MTLDPRMAAIISQQPEYAHAVLRGHYGTGLPFEQSCRALRRAMDDGGYFCVNPGRSLFRLIEEVERAYLETALVQP
jgi:hypothetical protein